MISLVVVSHSPALARAAVDLALEMVPSNRPRIAIAAGAGDDIIGTDAAKVADAIDEVATPDGVLVMMDLGSAVMSAELALEFRASDVPVVLSSGPFVEGLLAGIVSASGGASLSDVASEVRSAMAAKRAALPDDTDAQPAAPMVEPVPVASETLLAPRLTATLHILNPDGLHARPAAQLVTTMGKFDAKVTLVNRRTNNKPVAANSMISIMSLGAKHGDTIDATATGPQAEEALAKISAMAANGFGEL